MMLANLSRKSECQAHWRPSLARSLAPLVVALPPTVHRAPHLSQVRQGRTHIGSDRAEERASGCRGALRFCAMAETFTMTEGEEAARWGKKDICQKQAGERAASSHVVMPPSTNSSVEGCEKRFCSNRWPADSELTVSEDRDRPYLLAYPTLSPLRSCPSSACYVPRIPHTRTRTTQR